MKILTYAICDTATDLANINFNEVEQNSSLTIRKSVDESEFVIKWVEGNTPSFITDGTVTPSQTLDHAATLTLMATDVWSDPNQPVA